MKDEIILRKQAIELHLQGDRIVVIASKIGKSRQWVHKWINRYKTGGAHWYNSFSNAPKKVARTIPNDIEKIIVTIRKNLKEQKYAQKGALSILYEFERLNITPPSISTINRVIKRNGLIELGIIRDAKKKSTPTTFLMFSKWTLWDQSTLKEALDITY